MFLDGTSQRLVVPLNSAWSCEATIVGVSTNIGGGAVVYRSYENEFIANLNGNLTDTIQLSPFGVGPNFGFVSIQNLGNALQILAKSAGNYTVRWVAVIRTVEVEF